MFIPQMKGQLYLSIPSMFLISDTFNTHVYTTDERPVIFIYTICLVMMFNLQTNTFIQVITIVMT